MKSTLSLFLTLLLAALPLSTGICQVNSNENNALPFTVNNVEYMRISGTAGYVGIGTTGPAYPFDVSSSGSGGRFYSSNTTLSYLDVQNTGTATNAGSILRLISKNAAKSADNTVDFVKYQGGAFYINHNETNAAASMNFGVGGSARMTIDSAGDVGIGATNPLAKLDVNGTISASDAIQVGSSSLSCTAGVPGAIRYNSGNIQFCNGTSWATVGTSTAPGSSGDIVFNNGSGFAADTGQLYWDATNNRLGIGTASPDATLHVNAGSAASLTPKTGFFQIGDDASGANVNTVFDWQTIQTRTGGGVAANLFINPHGGNVGIGISSPQATLQVSGSFVVSTSAQAYTSPSLYVDTMGRVAIGQSVPTGILTLTSHTASVGTNYGLYSYLSHNPATKPNAHYRGLYLLNDYTSAQDATSSNSVRGGEFIARSMGTGDISHTYGLMGYGQGAGGSSMYGNTGVYGMAMVSNSTTSTYLYGAQLLAYDYNGPGVGGVNTGYGALIQGYSNAGRMTNYYGLYVNSFSGIDPTGDFFGIYQADAAMDNYFAGNVGIGVAAPNSKLEVNGAIATQGSLYSLRHIYGNYGFMHYQDGTNYYMLVTNSGDQYGTYNGLRPFYVNLANGNVTMSHNVAIAGTATVTGNADFNYGEIEIQGTYGVKAPFVRFHRPAEEYGQIRYGTDTTHDGYFHFRNINGATYADIAADTVSATTIIAAPPMLVAVEQQTAATQSGTCTAGSWFTRTLNTVRVNTISGASLASNQFTLPAGTYLIRASAPAFNVDRHKIRLYNVTDATDVVYGTSAFSSSAASYANDRSEILTSFTITASKALRIEHRCQTTQASNGLGVESDFATEVYTTVEITQIR